MAAELSAGERVRLKTGGPAMTVVAVRPTGLIGRDVHAYCTWLDEAEVKAGDFPTRALQPAD